MRLLIMGRPGAGKGTQAENIKEYFHIPHISSGTIFREAIKNQTKLGLIAQEYTNNGSFVPDEITIGIILERLAKDDCKEGFLLDGFPRTIVQAESLEKFLNQKGIALDAVLDINVPAESLVRRIVGRRVCSNCESTYHVEFNPPKKAGICNACGGELIQRDDDKAETVKKRLVNYDNQTAPLLKFYEERGLLKTVNGNQELKDVFEDIKTVLGA